MRYDLDAVLRGAFDVEPPPVPIAAIRARAAARAERRDGARASGSSLAVIAAMLLIGLLTGVMADRIFAAPVPVAAGIVSPAPLPTVT